MTTECAFQQHPAVTISPDDREVALGWSEILDRLRKYRECRRIVIECYPGVLLDPLLRELVARMQPDLVFEGAAAMLPASTLEAKFASLLGDDPVFGRLSSVALEEYFDPAKLDAARHTVQNANGRVIAIGVGASLVLPEWDLLIYVDISRWEIQQRQRRAQIGSLGFASIGASPAQLYKRGFFLDWRAADRHRHSLFQKVDYWIDGNLPEQPALLAGCTLRAALEEVSRRPFSLVPFFDPGPWGGQWMRRKFGLPENQANYAWCFCCVPEENSLALRFGTRVFEMPALTLVHEYPDALLGPQVVKQFGAEFPIRFDFLDTMDGGNLSLQVHPLTSYIREQFGLNYTQDESYYMLDVAPDAAVFLGLREGIDCRAMADKLREAQSGGPPFPAEDYVNAWPARKHDHFLIPAGTIHCLGRNSMVLEISATPYIFTFKLWDWGRMGLDGKPRPIHLEHGLRNIQWNRTTDWVRSHLIGQACPIASGEGWREERTGLHPLEFLETRRHWFTGPVRHDTQGNLNVLNLVEGEAVIVESPSDAFPPMTVHYAETFVVPAAVGPYTISPAHQSEKPMATIKAFVREGK